MQQIAQHSINLTEPQAAATCSPAPCPSSTTTASSPWRRSSSRRRRCPSRRSTDREGGDSIDSFAPETQHPKGAVTGWDGHFQVFCGDLKCFDMEVRKHGKYLFQFPFCGLVVIHIASSVTCKNTQNTNHFCKKCKLNHNPGRGRRERAHEASPDSGGCATFFKESARGHSGILFNDGATPVRSPQSCIMR